MFSNIEIAHYKCLKRASVLTAPFNVLIGPNASGKSSFLDSLAFVRDAIETDVERAVRKRAAALRELVWKNKNIETGFEIALEAALPAHLEPGDYTHIRYELGVGLDEAGSITVRGENLWLRAARQPAQNATPLEHFPVEPIETGNVVHPPRAKAPKGYHLVTRKSESGNNYFRSEKTDWNIRLRLAPQRLALTSIPEDLERFPLSLWFKQAILSSVQVLQLNSIAMRRTCPADALRTFQPDGSNLPLMVKALQTDQQRFGWWIAHLQTILDDLADVTVAERPEDRALYIKVTYHNGVSVPAWLLSDGTLRLLALTLIAYLPHHDQVFIIEEPENGIHPKAVEAVFKALRSVYDGQVFMATHSPLLLALAEPQDVLIFAKAPGGATAVVKGTEHPILRAWQGETQLETLFAAGVLG